MSRYSLLLLIRWPMNVNQLEKQHYGKSNSTHTVMDGHAQHSEPAKLWGVVSLCCYDVMMMFTGCIF